MSPVRLAFVGVLGVALGFCGCGGDNGASDGVHVDDTTTGIVLGGSVTPKDGGSVDGFFFVCNQNGDAVDIHDTEVTIQESTDGVQWQTISFTFDDVRQGGRAKEGGPGIAVAITMDYSQTMVDASAIIPLEDAVVSFVNHMSVRDSGEIIKFSSDVDVIQPFTSNRGELLAAVSNNYPNGGNTSLYDSMMTGVNDTSALDWQGLKAVLAMTDGRNNDSSATRQDVIDAAVSNGIPVFTVGLGDDINEQDLREVADSTHGFYYRAPSAEDLFDCYLRIAGVMDESFKCTWASTASSGAVKCKVGVSYRTTTGTYTAECVFDYVR